MWGLGWLGQAGLGHRGVGVGWGVGLGRRSPGGASWGQAGLGDLLVGSSHMGPPDHPQGCGLSRPAAFRPFPPQGPLLGSWTHRAAKTEAATKDQRLCQSPLPRLGTV